MMRTHRWLGVVACAAILLAPLTAEAQGIQDPFFAGLDQEGWVSVADGVFQRLTEDGSLETLGFGTEGLTWELKRMKGELARLQDLYAEEGSAELLDAITALEEDIVMTEGELNQSSSEPLSSLASAVGQVNELGCTLTVTRSASAHPTTSGPLASAVANFSDSCSTYGCVYSYAYAEGVYSGAFRSSLERDPASGWRCGYYSAASDAYASVVATTSCYSYAYAHVKILDSYGNWVNFTNSASNYKCRLIIEDPCLLQGLTEGAELRPPCPIPE